MKLPHYLFLPVVALTVLLGARPDKSAHERKPGQGGGASVEPAVVPEQLFNLLLTRPGATSITASILASKEIEVVIAFGGSAGTMNRHTPATKLHPGTPAGIVMDHLEPGTPCYYQLTWRMNGGQPQSDSIHSFVTQRPPGKEFTFALQADSHLDASTNVRVYQQTLANILAGRPDFMIDLGDTSMVDKFGSFYTRAESQYLGQRYYLSSIGNSVPMLFVLGNHDGEQGSRLTGQPNSMPLWSLGMRRKYFPNPEPGGIYNGNTRPEPGAGLLQDYYSWEWGSALFVVLDPFWFTRDRMGTDNWGMTLGEAQYGWLTQTLEASRAPFKFVFIHHLVGGLGRDARGGAAIAPYMEWGGKNTDGTDGFAQHRPGWAMPIHQLLVKHGVSIVFHGHDHLFAKEKLDGIIYQEVPQPGHPSGGTRSAEEYGYTGIILGSSGHLQVTVAPRETRVDYVRCSVPGVTRTEAPNGAVEHSYLIKK